MKRLILPIAAAALTVAAALPLSAGAKAKPAAPAAQIISHVKTIGDADAATVKARYVCPEGNHLWVSAKQSADGKKDPALQGPESSALSAAWLQNHPADFTCDGKWHTGTFQVDNYTEYGFGRLQRGVAWVQFCLIGETTFLSESDWVKVN
jgi:hypothetical protein